MNDSVWLPRLRRAQASGQCFSLERHISGADELTGYVIGVGRKWLLLANLRETRLDGYLAVRVRDLARIRSLASNAFYRKVAEATGQWPPAAPTTAITLDTTRGLIRSAHAHATLVNLQIERRHPDVSYIGVPTWWGDRSIWLQEVDPQAAWKDDLSEWFFADVTRVEFSSTYENDLLLVAGPPPSH